MAAINFIPSSYTTPTPGAASAPGSSSKPSINFIPSSYTTTPSTTPNTNISPSATDFVNPKTGILGKVADVANLAYQGFTELPPIKAASDVVGGAVGALGYGIGGVFGGAGQAIKNVATGKPITQNVLPQAESVAKSTGSFGFQTGAAAAPAAMVGGLGRIPSAVMSVGQGYQGVKDVVGGITSKDPNQALQGGLELGLAGMGALGAADTSQSLFTTPQDIQDKFGQMIPSDQAKIEATQTKNQTQLSQVNDSNATLRKMSDAAKVRGIDPVTIISQTDLLKGAVDKDGTIRTKQPGGAISKLDDFMEPAQSVIRDTTIREGKTIPLVDVKTQLVAEVNSSNLKGAAKLDALRRVAKDVAGYKLDANPDGTIDLSQIHDAKVDKQSRNDYANPDKNAADKAIATGLRKIVETNTDSADVKQLNSELAKYYTVKDYLESLDGKKVQGGRLAKYFNQTIGSMVGSHFGPIGTYIGGELAKIMTGANFTSSFSGGDPNALQTSPAMNAAIQANQGFGSTGKIPPTS